MTEGRQCCRSCGVHRQLSYFPRAPKAHGGGYRPVCKGCYGPAKHPAVFIPDGLKFCQSCRMIRPTSAFSRYHGSYQTKCKECDHAAYARIYERLGEQRNAQRRERWENDPTYREERLAAHQAWMETQGGATAYARKYRRAHPERAAANYHRHRARKRGNGGSFHPDVWQFNVEFYGGRCCACGSAGKMTIDHVQPLVAGGHNGITNLQPLCRSCNSRKNAKTIDFRTFAQFGIYLWSDNPSGYVGSLVYVG